MKCIHCGANLTQADCCPSCNKNIKHYKAMIQVSNLKYNEGLLKARTRDLSGAMDALKQCLKLNKEHVDARNLLGLVYFELGEIVEALGEWVISKNIRPEGNKADEYIVKVQNNQSKLEQYTQAVQKYNKALEYCQVDSADLALIQLKKVVSLNPNLVRAQLLLALIYLENKQWANAKKHLQAVVHNDKGNLQARSYLLEVMAHVKPKDSSANEAKKKKDVIRYEQDNELIIQPSKYKEPKTTNELLIGFLIGLAIGAGILFFLVLPGQIQAVRMESDEQIRVANEKVDGQASSIEQLSAEKLQVETRLQEIEANYIAVLGESVGVEGIKALLQASTVYVEDPSNLIAVAEYMDICIEYIDQINAASQEVQNLYHSLIAAIGTPMAESLLQSGNEAYRIEEYEVAIGYYERAVVYDTELIDALFFIAEAYRMLGNVEEATKRYQQVIELFPDNYRARQAQEHIDSF